MERTDRVLVNMAALSSICLSLLVSHRRQDLQAAGTASVGLRINSKHPSKFAEQLSGQRQRGSFLGNLTYIKAQVDLATSTSFFLSPISPALILAHPKCTLVAAGVLKPSNGAPLPPSFTQHPMHLSPSLGISRCHCRS